MTGFCVVMWIVLFGESVGVLVTSLVLNATPHYLLDT
jgi:hypothetical protein